MPTVNASTIGAQIQASPQLRQRIEAIVRNTWWNGTTTDPRTTVPIEHLAWAVAASAPIRTAIIQTLGSTENDWNAAIEAVPDSDLATVITAALTRLNKPFP